MHKSIKKVYLIDWLETPEKVKKEIQEIYDDDPCGNVLYQKENR